MITTIWKRQWKMDGSLLFTSGPVVATVPDYIRVTVVLPDIFGLASSQRTWLNLHTCTQSHTHRHTHASTNGDTEMQQRPLLSESIHFQPDWKLRVWRTYSSCPPTFLVFFWTFPGTPLFFLCLLLVCLRNPWNIVTLFVSALNTWYWDDQLVFGIQAELKVGNFVTWH